MKKINIISAVALSIAALASCSKAQVSEIPATPRMSFNAVAQAPKVALSGDNVLWQPEDAIFVFHGSTGVGAQFDNALTAPAATATFTIKDGETAVPTQVNGKFYALTPKAAISSWSSNVNAAKLTMPTDQEVDGPDMLPKNCAILYASSADQNFNFQHVLGYVCFTLDASSPADIVSVKIKNNTADQYLGGKFTLDLDNGNLETITATANKVSVTLAKSDASAFGVGTYYMALRPGDYDDGLEFTFTNSEGKIDVINVNHSLSLAAGDCKNVGTVANLSFHDDPSACPYTIGQIIGTGGQAGVVTHIDYDNKFALVMNLDVKSCMFKNARTLAGLSTDTNLASGKDETAKIFGLADYGDDVYPAAAAVKTLNGGVTGDWYIPSLVEIKAMAKSSKSIDTAGKYDAFNAILTANGSKAFDSTYTWTVVESTDATKMYLFRFSDSGQTTLVKNGNRDLRIIKKLTY